MTARTTSFKILADSLDLAPSEQQLTARTGEARDVGNAAPIRRGPITHFFTHQDQEYLFSPNLRKILRLDGPLLKSLINWPGGLTVADLRRASEFAGFSREDLADLIAGYDEFADRYLSSELAPLLTNDFDEAGFFERFQGSLSEFNFIPTHQCNMRCSYCTYTGSYEAQRQHENINATAEITEQAVRFITSLGGHAAKCDVSTYGGESLISWKLVKQLHQRLRETISPRKPLFFRVATNGILLTDEIMDYCITNDIAIQMSIDGPRHVHDRYRVAAGGQPTFDIVYGKLQRLYARDPKFFHDKVSISVVYGPPYDLEEADEWFRSQEMFSRHGTRRGNFRVAHVDRVGTTFFADKSGYEEQWARALGRMRQLYLDGLVDGDYEKIRNFRRRSSTAC